MRLGIPQTIQAEVNSIHGFCHEQHLIVKLLEKANLSEFASIRQKVRFSLHNQANFTLDEVVEFFASGAHGNQYLGITFSHSSELIGYVRLSLDDEHLFVGIDLDPVYQGIGLGRLIWDSLLSTLIFSDDYKVRLRVLKSNSVAIKLYKKLGFYRIEETESDILMEISEISFKPINMSPKVVLLVMGPKDEGFLLTNLELIQKTNPGEVFHFMIVNQDFSRNGFQDYVVLANQNRILVLQGDFEIDNSERDLFLRARASLFHARAIHIALHRIWSFKGLIILIDPDFYIIRKEWVREIDNMAHSGISFSGAGYHPKHITSYKNFPAAFFLCFNSETVPLEGMNFFPNPKEKEEYPGSYSSWTIFHKLLRKCIRLFLPITSQLTWRFKKSKDTGFALQRTFAKSKHFCFPIAIKKEDFFIPLILRSRVGRFFESFLFGKTKYSLMPLKVNYIEIPKSYLTNFNWDEYIFDNELFAFHIRKSNTISSYNLHLYESTLREVKENISNITMNQKANAD